MKIIQVGDKENLPDDFTGCFQFSSGSTFWTKNGKLHREDGPACIFYNGQKEWWLEDKQYSEEEYNKKVKEFFMSKKSEKNFMTENDDLKYSILSDVKLTGSIILRFVILLLFVTILNMMLMWYINYHQSNRTLETAQTVASSRYNVNPQLVQRESGTTYYNWYSFPVNNKRHWILCTFSEQLCFERMN